MEYSVSEKLKEKGLKVTPQRVSILDAVIKLKNHPTADNIIEYISRNHSNISTATVYKVLDALTESKLLVKVKTDNGLMRYDALVESHHHLYCIDTEYITDYHDEKITKLLMEYFKTKEIKNFHIKDIKLQIVGTFRKE